MYMNSISVLMGEVKYKRCEGQMETLVGYEVLSSAGRCIFSMDLFCPESAVGQIPFSSIENSVTF